MADTTVPGRGKVVWHDLLTNDLEASKTFFASLFGWRLEETTAPGCDTPYTVAYCGDKMVGGMVALEESDNAPSHWMSYVSVEDVDATVELAKKLNGEQIWPPTDLPEVGRFAVIRDPQGGHIAPFTSAHPAPPEENPFQLGHFCWEEFLAKDPTAASQFYGEIFGWSAEQMDMGEIGTYTLLKVGDATAAGVLKMPDEVQSPSHWLSYVMVEDVDAAVEKTESLGGCICKAGTDIPNVGRFAVAADPAGAIFAVWKPA